MYLITILDNRNKQYECSIGSFKEVLEFCWLLYSNPEITKYKITSSDGPYKDPLGYFKDSTKFCQKFYEEGELIK